MKPRFPIPPHINNECGCFGIPTIELVSKEYHVTKFKLGEITIKASQITGYTKQEIMNMALEVFLK